MKKFLRRVVYGLLALVVIGAIWWGISGFLGGDEMVIAFRTDKVMRGDVIDAISASGTVEPEELVNVGAQVSGKIMSFGKDAKGNTVDYGSEVKKGMVLAQIDEVLYEAALSEAQAQKLQAEVSILSADANLQQAKAKMVLAELNWKRAQELFPKGAQAKSDYDSAESNYLICKSDIAVAEADQQRAKAQLAIADAALVKAVRNLSYCVISSPVDGIIIDRRVSVGQTLVSNMSASSVFLIAKDLKKMEVWVAVNEADIGEIKPGMQVYFTVDAFPKDEFKGVVKKVRLNATMAQNVVTYVVEVSTDNTDGKLIPYLTANVRFVRKESRNVLYVPNASLRFRPGAEQVAPQHRQELSTRRRGGDERVVWVPDGKDKVRPVKIKVGMNNSNVTEVVSGLNEGDVVVTGASEVAASQISSNGEAKSPFMPTGPRRRTLNSAKK